MRTPTGVSRGAFFGPTWDQGKKSPTTTGVRVILPGGEFISRSEMSTFVTLPDYQGAGIGNALSNFVAPYWKGLGYRALRATTHPAMIASRQRSGLWRMTRRPSLALRPRRRPPGPRHHALDRRLRVHRPAAAGVRSAGAFYDVRSVAKQSSALDRSLVALSQGSPKRLSPTRQPDTFSPFARSIGARMRHPLWGRAAFVPGMPPGARGSNKELQPQAS